MSKFSDDQDLPQVMKMLVDVRFYYCIMIDSYINLGEIICWGSVI
jgi:hypothetical protein